MEVPRIARVFAAPDDATSAHGGGGAAASAPAGELDADERRRVARFLDGGFVLLAGGPLVPDRLDPAHQPSVPVGYATDGVWIWSASLRYYVAAYGLSPEPPFLAHIRARGYRPAVPAEEQVERANAELQAMFHRAAQDGPDRHGPPDPRRQAREEDPPP